MPASTEPRSGLQWGWTLGETPWKDGMDQNLLRLGRVGFHLSVKDRDLSTPPDSPVNGDTYIVGPVGTDAWADHDDHVAVWGGGVWNFYPPRIGWVAYVEDEEVLSAFKAGGWSAGVAI